MAAMTGKAIREALEPCPFCGASAQVREDDGTFCISCTAADCYAAVGEGYDRSAMPDHFFINEEAAAAAWNRRARTAYDAIGSGVKAEHIEAFRTVLESVLSAGTSGARSPAVDYEARRFIRDHGAAILASLSPDDAIAADAEIGRDFLNAIEAARDEYPWLADWTPAERYSELITDLLDIAFPALSPVEAEEADAKAGERPDIRAKAQVVVDQASDTYRKSNGHLGSIEGDDGEKCWIVPFDAMEELRAALASASSPRIGNAGAGPVAPDLQWGKQTPEGSWLACNNRDKLAEITAHFDGPIVPVTVEWDTNGDCKIEPAGAVPVGEAVAFTSRGQLDALKRGSVATMAGKGDEFFDVPLYTRPVEEPGEVERTAASYHESWLHEVERAEAAEAALAETREAINAALRHGDVGSYSARTLRAAITGDAQEAGTYVADAARYPG